MPKLAACNTQRQLFHEKMSVFYQFWPSAQVHETITFLLVTIHRFYFLTHRLSNKPVLIWLAAPPHLKYVATLQAAKHS